MAQILLWLMIIIPWISLLFIKKHSLKRFMPVAIFASLLVTIVFEMGYVFEWWIVQEKIVPWGHITSFPLTYGVFIAGTIWIFHFTFNKSFFIYILSNAIVDAIYAFVGLNILIYFGIYELNNMGHFGIFVIMVILAVIIYFYQKWQDNIIKQD
ncbi:hypothetical protein GMD78_20010 [Ornithinibacillus sp. L9]|uniref:Uncharacterized protein n=1 Tax=Ornithinibacillus caprae TaxID=2678566 RepID=A0A6N8FMT4_9BACI|nr:hypothetical protein [Ornithinibacillus caprae]MUK90643.1 hypothetical protein [Ornithinibacillus caprae]